MSNFEPLRPPTASTPPQTLVRGVRAPLSTAYQDYTIREWFEAAFVFAVLILTCWMLRSFLLPVAMAGIFAILLWPMRQRFLARGWTLGWTSLIVTVFFALMFLIPFVTITIFAVRSIIRQVQDSQQLSQVNSAGELAQALGLNDLYHEISLWLTRLPLPQDQVRGYLFKALQAVFAQFIDFLQKIISDLPQLFLGNIIIVATLFVLLSEGEKIVKRLHHLSPLDDFSNKKAFSYLGQLCQAVIWAALAAGGVQGAILTICAVLTGVGEPLTVGFLVFICSFVPIVGAAPVTVAIITFLVLKAQWSAALIYFVGTLLASLSDNFVRPLVMKGGGELHPLVGFMAAIGGLQLFGFYGIFVGPLLAGLCFYLLELRWKETHGY